MRFDMRSIHATPSLLACGIVVMATAIGCNRPPTPTRRPPNVLLITLDTTRADHLGCYGYDRKTSPHLDRLAAEGTRFTDAMTQAAVTPVSHASILTGQNPYTHGLRVMHGASQNRLPDANITLAEALRDAGYQTAAFVSAFPVTRRFGLDQGFETFDQDFIVDAPEAIVSDTGVVNTNRNQRRADRTSDRAIRWLGHARAPFFLWLHYFDPHDVKLLPPRAFVRAHARGGDTPEAQLRDLYDVEILYMDTQIGRVLDTLRQTGRLDDTLVIVTSDHGEGLGDHNWWTHGILYQEQIHAPLILRGPRVPAGRVVRSLVRSIDIMPTVLDLVGIAPARRPAMDGTSLVTTWRSQADEPPRSGYADSLNMLTYQTPAGTADRKNDMLFVLRQGRWKYIHHLLRPAKSELYDLRADPHEAANVIGEHRDLAARMRAALRARGCFPRPGLRRGPSSAEDEARLRSLGYITDTQPTP